MIRSVLAVLGGFATMTIMVMAMFAVVTRFAPGFAPQPGQVSTAFIVFNLVFDALSAVAGGAVTAAIANHARLKHVLALVGLLFVLSIVDVIGNWGTRPALLGLARLVLVPAAVYAGGMLCTRREPQKHAREAVGRT